MNGITSHISISLSTQYYQSSLLIGLWLSLLILYLKSSIPYPNTLLLYESPLLISLPISRIFLCCLLSLYYALLLVHLPKKLVISIKKKGKSWRSGINFPLPLPTYNYIYCELEKYEGISSIIFIFPHLI